MLQITEAKQITKQESGLEEISITKLIDELNVVDIVKKESGRQSGYVNVLEYDIDVHRIVAAHKESVDGERMLFLTQSRKTDCPIEYLADEPYPVVDPKPNIFFLKEYLKDHFTRENVRNYPNNKLQVVEWDINEDETTQPIYSEFLKPIEAEGNPWDRDERHPALVAVGKVSFKAKVHAFCK